MIYKYGKEEINYLKNKNKKLGQVIDQLGFIEREVDEDIFTAIIRAFLGQQVSRKSRETVQRRMAETLGGITPKKVNNATLEEIQRFGTTFRKAEYIKNFANMVEKQELNLKELENKSDTEVINILSKIKGIGVWTAEMLLCSALHRKDILSFGDLAIHRGLRMIFGHKEITKDLFEKYRKQFSPYATVASIYIWAVAAGAIQTLVDPKFKNKKITTDKTLSYF